MARQASFKRGCSRVTKAAAFKKIHDCVFCSKTFAKNFDLTIHMNFHTGERPYQCNQCSENFPDFRYLWTHRVTVHEGRQNKCDNSDYVTKFPGNLRRHQNSRYCHIRNKKISKICKTVKKKKGFPRKQTKYSAKIDGTSAVALGVSLNENSVEKNAASMKETSDLAAEDEKANQGDANNSSNGSCTVADESRSGEILHSKRPPMFQTSQILNLYQGLERVAKLKRCVPQPKSSAPALDGGISCEESANLNMTSDQKDKPNEMEVGNEPDTESGATQQKEVEGDIEGAGGSQQIISEKFSSGPTSPNEAPKEMHQEERFVQNEMLENSISNQTEELTQFWFTPPLKVDFILLPPDDHRSILASNLYPPLGVPGLPEHPSNLFYSIEGHVTEPVPSLMYLRSLASPENDEDGFISEDSELIEGTEEKEQTSAAKTDSEQKDTHVCGECGLVFKFRCKLLDHQVKHTQAKSFICSICGKQFAYQGNLRLHERNRHGRVPTRKRARRQERS